MANKGNRRHTNTLAVPVFYDVHRKEQMYLMKPMPGRHTLDRAIPIALALKKLGVATTGGAVRKVLGSGTIFVNNRVVKEPKFPVGLNDVIEVKSAKKSYKIGINQYAKITLTEEKDSDSHPFRVVGKYKASKGQVMIRLHDGSIVKAPKEVGVSDSVVLDSKGQTKKVLPLKVGAECFVVDGVHVGAGGTIKELKKGSMNTVASAKVKPKSGDEFETTVKNIMITG